MSANYTSKTAFGGWKNHKSVDKYIYTCKTCNLKYETFDNKTNNDMLQFILHTDMCYAKDKQEKLERDRRHDEGVKAIMDLADMCSNRWNNYNRNNRNNRNNYNNQVDDECVIL